MRPLVCVLLIAACSKAPPTVEPLPVEPTSALSPWVAARPAESVSLLEMPARVAVAAQGSGAVTPPYPARIVKVHVRVGQRVTRGGPVVDVIMPQLVGAAGNWVAARTRVEAYQRRKSQLDALKAEGLVRATELADVETKLAEARADQQLAAATLRAAGFSADEAPRIVDGGGVVPLRSPIDGVITSLDVAVGETRDPSSAPLSRIAGESPPRIEARLSHRLPPSSRYEFVGAGSRWPVNLVSQSPTIDPRDGTRLSWFEPAPEVALPGGLSGRLRIVLARDARAVVVPSTAVSRDRDQTFVVRRRGVSGERVPVEVLSASGADALVEGPLEPGQEVAADANRVPIPDGGAA